MLFGNNLNWMRSLIVWKKPTKSKVLFEDWQTNCRQKIQKVYITISGENADIFLFIIAILLSIKPIAKHSCHLDKSTWQEPLSG